MDAEKFNSYVWNRFVRMPYAHVLDCAEEGGDTFIPTAEECINGMPTVVGWTTPIADCAFFSGLYLYGLCEKYKKAPDEKTEKQMKMLADGLLLLCDIGKVDGFIARGVADDGVSHYPCSSEDQFGPWLLGLWAYTRLPACDIATKERAENAMRRTLSGVIGASWNIPSEIEGETCGSLIHRQFRCCAKLVFAAAVAEKLGVIDRKEYERLISEKPEGGLYSRKELLSQGFANDMIRSTNLIQFWIYTCGHLGFLELEKLDVKNAELWKKARLANGASVSQFLKDFEAYNRIAKEPFVHDWRRILPEVKKDYANFSERMTEAARINGLWAGTYNKTRNAERGPLAQCVFGLWIAITSGDEKLKQYAISCLDDTAEKVDWSKVGHSYPFVLECASYFI